MDMKKKNKTKNINKNYIVNTNEICGSLDRKNVLILIAILFFLFILGYLKYSVFPNDYPYVSTYYIFGYEFGFASRGLLGEIILNITPYISARNLVILKFILSVSVFFALSVIIVKISVKQKESKAMAFLMLLPLCLPVTFQFGLDGLRQDFYLAVLFIISAVFVAKDRFILCIPLFIVAMMLLQETAILMVVPQTLMMLLYGYCKTRKKEYLISFVCSLGFACWLAIFFLFFQNRLNPEEIRGLAAHISNHTSGLNIDMAQTALSPSRLSVDEQSAWNLATLKKLGIHLRIFLISLIPFFVFLNSIFKNIEKMVLLKYNDENRNILVFFRILFRLSVVAPMLLTLLSMDLPRYIAFYMLSVVVYSYTFLYMEDMQLNLDDICMVCKKKRPFFLLFILIYGIFYGPFGASVMSTAAVRSISNIFLYLFN